MNNVGDPKVRITLEKKKIAKKIRFQHSIDQARIREENSKRREQYIEESKHIQNIEDEYQRLLALRHARKERRKKWDKRFAK
jgi:hypothetical protein